MREMAAKVSKLESEAKNIAAKAEREVALTESQRFDDAKTVAETKRITQEIEQLSQETTVVQNQMLQSIEGMIDQM